MSVDNVFGQHKKPQNVSWESWKLKRNFGDWPVDAKFQNCSAGIFHLVCDFLIYYLLSFEDMRPFFYWPDRQWEQKIYLFLKRFLSSLQITKASHEMLETKHFFILSKRREMKIFILRKVFFHYFYSCRVLFKGGKGDQVGWIYLIVYKI